MAKTYDLARVTTATVGTGTITLGSAVSPFLTFANAGVVDQDIVSYAIKDGANSEKGLGLYTASGTTLTRIVTSSTNSNAAISLSGSAEVFLTPSSRDLVQQPITPGGRLTLQSGVPVMTTTQSAKTTLFYTPYSGAYVPLYDGTSFVQTEFAEMSQLTTDATKSPAAVVAEACYDIFAWYDAGTLRATRGPVWTKASTVTVTIASPAVITWTGHGLKEGMPVVFSTTGALPTGITAGTIYYVAISSTITANTFQICTTMAHVVSATMVNTSGTQSGVHTGTNKVSTRGTGAGTSELQAIKGIWTNKNAITNGPAANKGTYLGTIRTNATSSVDWIYAGIGSGGVAGFMNVWNCYNRRATSIGTVDDNTVAYNFSGNFCRAANASLGNRINFVLGLLEDAVYSWSQGDVSTPGTLTGGLPVGRGHSLNTTSFVDAAEFEYSTSQFSHFHLSMVSSVVDLGTVGSHFISNVEYGNGTDVLQYRGDNDTLLQVIVWN